MAVQINGWQCIGETDVVAVLTSGDNIPQCAEYLQIIPTVANNRIVGFTIPDGPPECQWIMEVANADPTQTYDVLLIGGTPAQTPPQILLPPTFSEIRIKPGFTQRVYYRTGTGWVPLFAGVPET